MNELGTLRVNTSKSAAQVVLAFVGELDHSTVPIFVDAIDDALREGAPGVELDLTDLGFIDSSGVGAYVRAFRRAQAGGARLSVGGRSPLVERVLQLCGVEDALAMESAADR